MHNSLSQEEPYTSTVDFVAADGTVYQTIVTERKRLSRALYDVLPTSNAHGDHKRANFQEFRTWNIRDAVGASYIIDGPYPQSRRYTSYPVYPGTDTTDGNLGFSEVTTLLENIVVPKLLSAMKGASLQLAVSAAEGRQSASMVARAVKSTLTWKKQASRLLRELARPLRNGSKRAANLWLEATYGWVPLMSDVWNSANFHRTWLLQRTVWAQHGITHAVTRSERPASFWMRDVQGSVSTRLRMSRTFRVTNTQLFDANRLGLLNPLSTAWELLPYSFVADWFIDIGGYLQGLETACGLGYDVIDGYNSYSELVTTRTDISTSSDPVTYGYRYHYGTGSYRGSWKRREVALGIPLPRAPTLSIKLGASRIISAGSLVRQLF